MNNINKLLSSNKAQRNSSWERDTKYTYHYNSFDARFTGHNLRDMIEGINFLNRTTSHKFPIQFHFNCKDIEIADKLTYILTECLFYYLIIQEKRHIKLYWDPIDIITTNGIFKSPLVYLNRNYNKQMYIEKFHSDFNPKDGHFRKIFSKSGIEDPYYISKITMEIDSFLNFFNLSEDSKEKLSQICTELIENSLTHGDTDCLIDIDITNSHTKHENGKEITGNFYGVNMAIVNFSDKILPTDVSKKMTQDSVPQNEPYKNIHEAYINHKKYFNEKYIEENFWCLASMQKGISGRDNSVSGGTGLYVLLSSLMKKADMDACYMISGKSFIRLDSEMLSEKENLFGFNMENDFINFPPEQSILDSCSIYMPGTAYNLNFIMKDEGEKV